MALITTEKAKRWKADWPDHIDGHEVQPGGLIVIYDDPDTAEALARSYGGEAKHSPLKGNPHFTTFSVVVLT